MPKSLLATVALIGCSPTSFDAVGGRDDTFVTSDVDTALRARFDRDGVRLAHDQDDVTVRPVAWGRDRTGVIPNTSPRQVGDRVHYETAGLTEWWQVHPSGLEQGFQVSSAPRGAGQLSIELAVEGAEVVLLGPEALRLEGGASFQVSSLLAWDATGRALPSHFERSDSGFRVRVDDRGAEYPIDIDPVYAVPAVTFVGEAAGNWFGASASDAGDVNGDGYSDVVVGAWGYGGNIGRAYLFLGSGNGLSTVPATIWTGLAANDFLGVSVGGGGDVDGDGFDDVLVGSYGANGNTGLVHVYRGSINGAETIASTTLLGEAAGGFFGVSCADAGDVNADGYDDVVVGAHGFNGLTGRAYVFLGGASGPSLTPVATMEGEAPGDYYGVSVAGAGDVDADGFDEVVVGAYYYSGYTGRAYVYPGAAAGTSTTAATTLTGEPSSHFGVSVSGAGDVDADGYDDVIIGARNYATYTGRAYVFAGGPGGLSAGAITTLDGGGVGERFGNAVSDAGDVNADGYGDVIVGAAGFNGDQGRATVFEGSAIGLATTGTRLDGVSPGDSFGYWLSGAGDIDADGYSDVLVGAPLSGGTGTVVLHRGRELGVDTDGDGYDQLVDCDDLDPNRNPGAIEVCDAYDVDEDCDGSADDDDVSVVGRSTWYADDDGDTHGGPDASAVCDPEPGSTSVRTDCDDADPAVHPGADEICNLVDDDCDGTIDVGAIDEASWYRDDDNDGYTDPTDEVRACEPPSSYDGATAADCDDEDPEIHPGAIDLPGDGVDQDCSGQDTPDLSDGDGTAPTSGSDTTTDDKYNGMQGGCGCSSATEAAPTGLGALLALVVFRRRRSGARPW